MTRTKICGLTSVEDARAAVESGADALGLNLWPRSKRVASLEVARRIYAELASDARVVFVVVDAELEQLKRLRGEFRDAWLQLHGDESPETAAALGGQVIKALPASPDVADVARLYVCDELLVDAAVTGERGGTGVVADWDRAKSVQVTRPCWLAGGLNPENVSAAIDAVRPYGVDVASGVESGVPGIKDLGKVRAFIDAVRASSV